MISHGVLLATLNRSFSLNCWHSEGSPGRVLYNLSRLGTTKPVLKTKATPRLLSATLLLSNCPTHRAQCPRSPSACAPSPSPRPRHSPTEWAGNSRNHITNPPIQAKRPVTGTTGLLVIYNTHAYEIETVNALLTPSGIGMSHLRTKQHLKK